MHAYLPGMVARNSGRILNVSSTASMMPGPLQAVYYATKAYVTSMSQAVAEEPQIQTLLCRRFALDLLTQASSRQEICKASLH